LFGNVPPYSLVFPKNSQKPSREFWSKEQEWSGRSECQSVIAAIIRVVAPCKLVVKKWTEAPKIKKPPAVQSGSVAPYSLIALEFGNKKTAVKFGSVRLCPRTVL